MVNGPIDLAVRQRVCLRYRREIERLLAREHVDAIHFHGIDFHDYLPIGDVPALATLHLPPAWYPPVVFAIARPNTFLNCVSAAQRRTCPPCSAMFETIENGVPVEALSFRCKRRSFVVAMGRICPEKNLHVALDAARLAGVDAVLAGQVFPYESHERYFRDEIAPRLDARRRFVGPATFARKRRLLSAARCLLLPTIAPETSSLIAMESLACGTPVVAFRSGALPELIEPGVTGFLVTDAREMADAIAACEAIDRDTCRGVARARFDVDQMTGRYLDAYQRLAQLPRLGRRAIA